MERQIRGPPAAVRHMPPTGPAIVTSPPPHPPSCKEVAPRAAAPRHAILDFHQALGEAGPLDPPPPAGGDRHSTLKPSASKSGKVLPRGLTAVATVMACRGEPPTGVAAPQVDPLEVGDSPPSVTSLGPRAVDSAAPIREYGKGMPDGEGGGRVTCEGKGAGYRPAVQVTTALLVAEGQALGRLPSRGHRFSESGGVAGTSPPYGTWTTSCRAC